VAGWFVCVGAFFIAPSAAFCFCLFRGLYGVLTRHGCRAGYGRRTCGRGIVDMRRWGVMTRGTRPRFSATLAYHAC